MSNAIEDDAYEQIQALRRLFVKYIQHINRVEGVDFILDGQTIGPRKFTKREIATLESLAWEAVERS